MLRKLLYAVPLCLATQMAFAEYDLGVRPKIEKDPEPNWETAAYSCPLSIKTAKGEFNFSGARVLRAGNPLAELAPEPYEHIQFRFRSTKEIDVVCEYEGFNTGFVMRLKGVTACGGNEKPFFVACWTTDPYAGKKK